MWGTYFNADNKWQGQVFFSNDSGFCLKDRVTKTEDLIPLDRVQRVEVLPQPAWIKWLGSHWGIFLIGFVLGCVVGALFKSSIGSFMSGVMLGIVLVVLNLMTSVFAIGHSLQLHAEGRPSVRIQMPKKFLSLVQGTFPRWFA